MVADYQVGWLKGAGHVAQSTGVTARALRDNPSSMGLSDDPLVRLELMYATFAGMLSGARVAGVRRGGGVLGGGGGVGTRALHRLHASPRQVDPRPSGAERHRHRPVPLS